MKLLHAIRCLFHLFLLPRSQLVLENLALRQQLAVLSRQWPRPALRRRDRLFWVCLTKLYSGWRSALVVVQPDTVIRWHRQGFRRWQRWKSWTKRAGRPPLPKEVRTLIGRMSRDNPTRGAPASRPNCVFWAMRSPMRGQPNTCRDDGTQIALIGWATAEKGISDRGQVNVAHFAILNRVFEQVQFS
jgi:hypothetical protein